MKKKLLCLLVIICSSYSQTALAQGRTHTDPADIGVTVKSVIQIGSVQTSNYDVAVTVLETLRGDAALSMIKSSGQSASAPETGYEYLLTRIRFALNNRAVSDTGVFDLVSSPFQWVVYSSTFSQYDNASVTPPEPALKGSVSSGETREGWLVFAVEEVEEEPMLMFDPSTGGAEGRGKKLFFKIY